jgi:lipoate-protein ligase A
MLQSRFRFIIDDARDSYLNMGIDEALLASCERNEGLFPSIRFYRWEIPTLSFGYNQRYSSAVDEVYCRESGINIVRRPTGGRAVLHDVEVTYSVVGRTDDPRLGNSVLATYRLISLALARGFARLGIKAELVAPHKASPAARGSIGASPCFFSPSRYELVVSGKKVVGSAQKRGRGAFLQHGSIPLEIDIQKLLATTGHSSLPSGYSLTSVNEAAGRDVSPEELVSSLSAGFANVFQAELISERLTEKEYEDAKLLREKYQSDSWNKRV